MSYTVGRRCTSLPVYLFTQDSRKNTYSFVMIFHEGNFITAWRGKQSALLQGTDLLPPSWSYICEAEAGRAVVSEARAWRNGPPG